MASSYFLVESKGYYYCVKKGDLLVSKDATVEINQQVPFRFGAKTWNGTVLLKSG